MSALLTVILGMFVGYVPFELAAVVLSGCAAQAGVVWILLELVLVCGGIAPGVTMVRRGSR